MRIGACLLLVVVGAACGSTDPGAGAGAGQYGISLEAPAGWDARVTRGLIRIARGEVSVILHEYDPGSTGEAVYFRDPWPVRLDLADFGRQADGDEDDTYLTAVSGRLFSVFPGPSRPSEDELAELNRTLATLRVERGDFYPGSVQGIAFSRRPGWLVGDARTGERRPQGEFVTAWAATSAYEDGPDAFPSRTLRTLPRDGIVIWVMLSRGGPDARGREREETPPYRFRDLERRDGWEGQVRDLPEYVLWASFGEEYLVDLRAYFGRPDPSPAMLAEADAMIAGLRFPDWGSWELEAD